MVRGFGAPPGVIPHSQGGPEPEAGAGRGATFLARFAPQAIVAYDALSPRAWQGARQARRSGAALVLVESGVPGSAGRLHERILQGVGERLWGGVVRGTARRVVALDPLARERALAQGFAEERVALVPEGVDVVRFRPGLTSSLVGRRRIRGRILLYVGPVERGRGLRTLIEAFGRTVGQREDWALVLSGEGSASRELRALGDRIGVGARVHHLPRARPEELPGLLGASTLLAVPDLDPTRARPRTIVRALAAGLPVLASELPRLAWFVEPEGTGLLVRPGDRAAWTDAIQRAASSPEMRRRWGARGRELAETRFSWASVGEAFERLLEGELGEEEPGGGS